MGSLGLVGADYVWATEQIKKVAEECCEEAHRVHSRGGYSLSRWRVAWCPTSRRLPTSDTHRAIRSPPPRAGPNSCRLLAFSQSGTIDSFFWSEPR